MKKKITTLLIDDDPEALALLGIYLRNFPEVELLGRIEDATTGLELIEKNAPSLIFLDIEMPGLSGMEIARVIHEKNLPSEVVFTTAHKEYAFDTLGFEPVDYLLKPFGPEEIRLVINKYNTRIKRKELDQKLNPPAPPKERKIKLPTRKGFIYIHPDEPVLLRSEGNYTHLFLSDGTVDLITLNIYKIALLLRSPNICRISRAAFVNIQFLRRIDKRRRVCLLTIKDKIIEETISRSHLPFFERLNCFHIS